MIDFYDSNCATRAINTYFDFVKKDDIENKELLILTLIAYKGEISSPFICKVLGDSYLQLNALRDKGYIKVTKTEGRTNYYSLSNPIQSSKVFPDNIMYIFCNALFNVKKYNTTYRITSWNTLATMVELPLYANKNSIVTYTPETIQCVGGQYTNRMLNRKKLISMGVIKETGKNSQVKLNQYAYLLGAD